MIILGKALLLILGSVLLVRLSGRKSLSQMTLGTTIVMISVGAVIVEPIVDKDVQRTLWTIACFIATLVLLEWLQLKVPLIERILFGCPVIVITDGKVHEQNLRKLRITRDKLATRLRKHGISYIADIQTATIEPNGELGFELRPGARPLTVDDFLQWMTEAGRGMGMGMGMGMGSGISDPTATHLHSGPVPDSAVAPAADPATANLFIHLTAKQH